MPDTGVKAGRELDAKIAEKVMGWTDINRIGEHGWRGTTPEGDREKIEFYSTDIAAAWEVVEKIKTLGSLGFQVHYYPSPHVESYWAAGILKYGDAGEPEMYEHDTGRGDTAPLAICLAALKTVEGR